MALGVVSCVRVRVCGVGLESEWAGGKRVLMLATILDRNVCIYVLTRKDIAHTHTHWLSYTLYAFNHLMCVCTIMNHTEVWWAGRLLDPIAESQHYT